MLICLAAMNQTQPAKAQAAGMFLLSLFYSQFQCFNQNEFPKNTISHVKILYTVILCINIPYLKVFASSEKPS